MADVSQVLINSTTYSIKDAVARAAIGSLNSFEYYVCTDDYNTPDCASFEANNVEIFGELSASAQTKFKIYLVPAGDALGNTFDEYITVEPESGVYLWERFGSTSVDINGYLTTADAAATYAPKVRPVFSSQIAIGEETLTELQLRDIKSRRGFEYVVCDSAANTPAGIAIGNAVGALTASAQTEQMIFMVPSGGEDGNKYDEYIAVREAYSAASFELENGETLELEDGSPFELSGVDGGSGSVQYRYVWERIGGGAGSDQAVVVCSNAGNTPAGVKIKSSTGALSASAATENILFLVKSGKGNDKYDEYITVKEEYRPVTLESEDSDPLTDEDGEAIEADGIEVESDEPVQYRYAWEKLGKTVTPDWDEIDENSPGFIKNRPFGRFVEKGRAYVDDMPILMNMYVTEDQNTGNLVLTADGWPDDGFDKTIERSEIDNISFIQISDKTISKDSIKIAEDNGYVYVTDEINYDNLTYGIVFNNIADDTYIMDYVFLLVNDNYISEEQPPNSAYFNITIRTTDTIVYRNIEAGGTRQGSGKNSTVQGSNTVASAENAFAAGTGTIASNQNMFTFGEYNDPDDAQNLIETVGNGTSDNYRSNARMLDRTGHEWLSDTLSVARDPLDDYEVATKQYVDNATPVIDFSPYATKADYATKLDPVFQNSISLDSTSITESQLISLLDVLSNIQPAAGVSF